MVAGASEGDTSALSVISLRRNGMSRTSATPTTRLPAPSAPKSFTYSGLVATAVVPLRLGDHAREVAREERRETGHEHPAAHHDPLILLRRELADHRVSDRRDEQLTDALQHITHEQPPERTLAVDAGQLDAERENEKAQRHQDQRRRKLLRYVDPPSARAQSG